MQGDVFDAPLIEEKRLVGTWITTKPTADAFLVASGTVILMSLLTLFFWLAPQSLSSLMPSVREQVFTNGQFWRLFTAMFAHADIEHLLSNMYMLWIFSYFVFGYFGSKIFPLLSLLLGALINAFAILTYPAKTELIGASGLVYFLGGLWLTLYFLIQRQYRPLNRTLRVVGIALMIFVPSEFVPSTSYRTHAIGFAIGTITALFYFLKNKEKIRSKEEYKISFV